MYFTGWYAANAARRPAVYLNFRLERSGRRQQVARDGGVGAARSRWPVRGRVGSRHKVRGASRALLRVCCRLPEMIASFRFLSRALRKIPVGTGYAIWTGIGAVGAAIFGMIWLGESRTAARMTVC